MCAPRVFRRENKANKTTREATSSPGPSARYPRQMALVQADVTGIVSGGSAKILFLFLIAQTGLNNAMRMSILLKFGKIVVFSLLVSFSPLTFFVRNKEKSFEWRASISVFVCKVGYVLFFGCRSAFQPL